MIKKQQNLSNSLNLCLWWKQGELFAYIVGSCYRLSLHQLLPFNRTSKQLKGNQTFCTLKAGYIYVRPQKSAMPNHVLWNHQRTMKRISQCVFFSCICLLNLCQSLFYFAKYTQNLETLILYFLVLVKRYFCHLLVKVTSINFNG